MSTPDPISVESESLLMEHSDAMHKWLMNIAIVYSLLFSMFSVFLNDIPQAIGTFAAFPLAVLSSVLFKMGLKTTSKVFNLCQIMLVVTSLCLLAGNESFAFMYYFPIIISTLLIFQGKKKNIGYLMVGIAIALLMVVTSLDFKIDIINLDVEHQKADQLSNIIGVCTSCILLFVFSIKSSDIIQKRLLEKTQELQIKNEQLAAAVFTRDKMMSVISHDLRSPIIALNSAMNVFINQDLDPMVQKEIVGQIQVKSNKLLTMIDDLLCWTKAQSTSIRFHLDKIETGHIIYYTNSLIELMGSPKNIELEIINRTSHKYVLCDKNLIEAILRNLVSNAIKFSPIGNKIVFSLLEINNRCEISIRDYGKGMTEKELEDFYHGVSFTTKGTANEKGHGLGLQLVKEFLHKQNSILQIESFEGFGSRFYFSLPISN
ncbi:MAG: sensor histidine kinase [Bacteroidota bacterium]